MTGKTRKKLPPLAQVQSDMALTAHSDNGDYLGGLTGHGDLFLWKKDMDEVKTFVSPLSRMSTKTLKDNKAFAFHREKIYGLIWIMSCLYFLYSSSQKEYSY